MEYPTYKLSGVFQQGESTDFEGPLTLILTLLSKNKIEIKDIRISDILDQYLEYLDEMASMDMDIATEFVAMASHLVYIKSRMLLDTPEEIDELTELISSLEALKAKNIARNLRLIQDDLCEMYRRGAGLIPKSQEELKTNSEYRYKHDKNDLIVTLISVLTAEKADKTVLKKPVIPMPVRTVYPVSEKSEGISTLLRRVGSMKLSRLFAECESKSEVVAAFLAVLDLLKNGRAYISQEDDEKEPVLCEMKGE